MTQLRLTLALTLGLAVTGFAALAQETAAPTEAPAAEAPQGLGGVECVDPRRRPRPSLGQVLIHECRQLIDAFLALDLMAVRD